MNTNTTPEPNRSERLTSKQLRRVFHTMIFYAFLFSACLCRGGCEEEEREYDSNGCGLQEDPECFHDEREVGSTRTCTCEEHVSCGLESEDTYYGPGEQTCLDDGSWTTCDCPLINRNWCHYGDEYSVGSVRECECGSGDGSGAGCNLKSAVNYGPGTQQCLENGDWTRCDCPVLDDDAPSSNLLYDGGVGTRLDANPGNDWDSSPHQGADYSYVLVEDLSTTFTGEAPGADIDAISATIGGVEHFATAVTDFNLGGGSYLDPLEATGPPDSSCTENGFVALGGLGGYLVVTFGATFKSGDTVTVYELGPTTCPNQAQWVDEDYRVSVSISDINGNFVEIGQGGTGLNTIVVP